MSAAHQTHHGARILLVDDEPNVLKALQRSLRALGFDTTTAACGAEALRVLERQPVDAIVSDMRMPGIDGAELLTRSRLHAPDAVRVLLTGHADVPLAVAAINEAEIFRYVEKPWNDSLLHQALLDGLERRALERERNALLEIARQQNDRLHAANAALEEWVVERTEALGSTVCELHHVIDRLKPDFSQAVRLFSSLIEMRGGLTARCARVVAGNARTLGASLGVEGEALHNLTFAALLQDIGKLTLPDALLRMPMEALDGEQLSVLLRHPMEGEKTLRAFPSLRGAGIVLRHVNENFDGTGAPENARRGRIPWGARILRVASDFEYYLAGALETQRLSREQALNRLARFRGSRYDPDVVDAFMRRFGV